jgi:hypothetical protein
LLYTIDLENQLVHVKGEGAVTPDVIRGHWEELFSDPDAMRMHRFLVDLRAAELHLTGQQNIDLTRRYFVPRGTTNSLWFAFVVATPLQYGIIRQHHAVAGTAERSGVFYDHSEALAWLDALPHP